MASGFKGELWSQDVHACKKYGINHVQGDNKHKGLTKTNGVICFGGNSGHQAINLAYLFGAKTIILLGYDMKIGEKTHWFGDHPKGLQVPSPFGSFIDNMNLLAKDAQKVGLKIINASRETALTCFERSTMDDLFC